MNREVEGPWGWVYDGSSDYSIGQETDPQGRPVAQVHSHNPERGHSICALISAVPELLSVLKMIEWNGHGMSRCPCCFGWEATGNGETDRHHNATCLLAKAVAKAEGKS